MAGYTNADALTGAVSRAAHPVNASAEASFTDQNHHWALVISCPTSSLLANSSTAVLNLLGQRDEQVVYSRAAIPVSRSRYVQSGVDFALCTMVQRGSLTGAEYLQPWAQYNLALGFSQLLVYVEEADSAWVEKALHKDIKNGQVTIVPFYFGNVSEQRVFLMQGAMESHCLYQARGMAKWMAHADIDEYFDFLRPGVNLSNYLFPDTDSKDVALVVRSKFWGTIPDSSPVASRFPCNINGVSMYTHDVGKRSKVIMRPEYIDGLFPHFVVKRSGYTELHPDPSVELRLNHFKSCDARGQGCYGTVQHTWKSEHKKLLDDGNDWKDRCEALLGATKVH